MKNLHHKLHRYPTLQHMWIHKVYKELGEKKLDKQHLMEITTEDVWTKT